MPVNGNIDVGTGMLAPARADDAFVALFAK
jgi:hypothetical protein